MANRQSDSFAALGRALAAARDDGVLDSARYAHLAGALAAGILTGSMAMDDYAAVHEALATILEAAFSGAATPPAPIPARAEEGSDFLEAELEVMEEVWGDIDLEEEEENERAGIFVQDCFDLDRSSFGPGYWFAAPLKLPLDGIRDAARRTGLAVIEQQGPFDPRASFGVLQKPDGEPPEGKLVLGWGDRRLILLLRPVPSAGC
jgi:hypothetical protein